MKGRVLPLLVIGGLVVAGWLAHVAITHWDGWPHCPMCDARSTTPLGIPMHDANGKLTNCKTFSHPADDEEHIWLTCPINPGAAWRVLR